MTSFLQRKDESGDQFVRRTLGPAMVGIATPAPEAELSHHAQPGFPAGWAFFWAITRAFTRWTRVGPAMDFYLNRPGLRITLRRCHGGLLCLREEEPRPGSSAHINALIRRPHLLQQALAGRLVTLPAQETERRMLRCAEDLRRLRLPALSRDERERLENLSREVFGPERERLDWPH